MGCDENVDKEYIDEIKQKSENICELDSTNLISCENSYILDDEDCKIIKCNNTAIILGSVGGGLALFLCLVAVFAFLVHRNYYRKRNSLEAVYDDVPESYKPGKPAAQNSGDEYILK